MVNEKLEKIISINIVGDRITIEGCNREYYWEIVHDKNTKKVIGSGYSDIRSLISDEEYKNLENLSDAIAKIRNAYEEKEFASYDTGRDKKCKMPGLE